MLASDLSSGERLFLDRWRRGQGQRAAAKEYGVGLYTYRLWEEDKEAVTTDFDPPAIGHMTEAEGYVIMRRRRGLGTIEAAEKIGVSRFWLREMEAGRAPIDRLREFWNGRAA